MFPSKDQLRDCFSYSQVMRGQAVNIDKFVQTHTPFSLIKVVQSKIKMLFEVGRGDLRE